MSMSPTSFYRWNPYNSDGNPRSPAPPQEVVLSLFNNDIDPSKWLIESCSRDRLPADPVPIFIGQIFNHEPKRVLAVIAWAAGVQFYFTEALPTRSLFSTVLVAPDDAPKLLAINKKLKCEISDGGERVIRMALGSDGELEPRFPSPELDGRTPSPVEAEASTSTEDALRSLTGIPQSAVVIELSNKPPGRRHKRGSTRRRKPRPKPTTTEDENTGASSGEASTDG